MINKDNLDQILLKYFEGKADKTEVVAISRWLDESNHNVQYFIASKKSFIEIQAGAFDDSGLAEKAYTKFMDYVSHSERKTDPGMNLNPNNTRKVIVRIASVAAIILVSFLLGYFLFNPGTPRSDTYCEFHVPYGSRSSLFLPDGTEIWINAGSRIKYNYDYGVNTREVILEGEAFFNVEKDDKPFIVHTSHLSITALGTSFNVKSYPEEDNIETTLIEGKIRVEQKASAKVLELIPNQKLTYHKTSEQYSTLSEAVPDIKETEEEKEKVKSIPVIIEAEINIQEEIAWKDGKLIINNEPFEELAKKLERKYDIVFKFTDNDLKKYSYSGTLRDFPLEQVLRALELTSPVKYTIKEKTVYLYPVKSFKTR